MSEQLQNTQLSSNSSVASTKLCRIVNSELGINKCSRSPAASWRINSSKLVIFRFQQSCSPINTLFSGVQVDPSMPTPQDWSKPHSWLQHVLILVTILSLSVAWLQSQPRWHLVYSIISLAYFSLAWCSLSTNSSTISKIVLGTVVTKILP